MPVTPELVQARAREMWERMLHSLSHRGISREAYMQISGRDEQETLAEMQADAELALRREAVLTAIVAAEQISPRERGAAGGGGADRRARGASSRRSCWTDLRANGRLEELREDLAARMAVELIAERAKPISVEQAAGARGAVDPRARTASREQAVAGGAAGAPGKLWTPTGDGSAS